jgi:glycosyltransferase involved in cell wall biosynthesis
VEDLIVSIGIPVYNGDASLKKRLDSILAQTLKNFQVIISDNASTDHTEKICREYNKNDSRFHYFRQDKNIGIYPNFIFVLNKAHTKYFVWAAADDLWTPDFLEKNIKILESSEEIVCSIGVVQRIGLQVNEFKMSSGDSSVTKIYKKIRRSFRPFGSFSITGNYEKRIRTYLKNISSHDFYGIHRTEFLKKSIPEPSTVSWDCALLVNLIKFGEIHMIDEVLLYYNTRGLSSKLLEIKKHMHGNALRQVILPWSCFSYWCFRKLGLKTFIKNLDRFTWLVCLDLAAILISPIKLVSTIKK